MYGLVNKSIVNLIKEEFGLDAWKSIQKKSEISQETFLANEGYDDSVTYSIVMAASEILKLPVSKILFRFGNYWVNVTAKKEYPDIMESGGDNLRDFFKNLPNFHTRVALIYPNLSPPEFNVSDEEEKSIILHYHSDRPGLKDFVVGLIYGLGEYYNTKINVEEIMSREKGDGHESFRITWIE